MKRVFILAGAMTLAATAACGDDEEQSACQQEAQAIAALSGNASAGQAVFGTTCANAACHGADGNSGPAPDLTVTAAGRSTAQLTTVVNCGAGTMAALGGQLTDQEIADVVAYVQQTFQ